MMHQPTTRGVHGYRAAQSQTTNPLELVVMLYDGALRFLGEAVSAFEHGERATSAHAISRAMAIVNELQATLDLGKGGEIASELDRLYDFVRHRLLDATRDQSVAPIHDARAVLANLADAWRTIAAAPQTVAKKSA